MAVSVGVGLVGISIVEQRKRAKRTEAAQARRSRVESAIRADEARRSRREQVREARIKQAQLENLAATTGGTGSSAAIAATSSLQAKLGTNIGSIQTSLLTSEAKSIAEQDIFAASRPSTLELLTTAAVPFAVAKV